MRNATVMSILAKTTKKNEQGINTWETQKSWVALKKNKSWATKTKIMRISKVMSSLYQKKNLKTFENQLTTWEIQKAWVALLKKQKNTWAGNQTLRNSKVMSSLFDKKHIKNSWATNDNMGNSKGISSLTAKHTWAGNRKNEKLKSHE